jgi:hypothetical protein
MDTLESHRKTCLERQTELRSLLADAPRHAHAMQMLLRQHAALHSARLAPGEPWSLEDEILDDMPEQQLRHAPPTGAHSVAWLIWHIARCEDITMNLLVAGAPQVLDQDDWLRRIQSPVRDTGNAMDASALTQFNRAVDTQALRGYRLAVGRRTRELIQRLQPVDLTRKVTAASIQQVMDAGDVTEAARGIADYWSKRTVAGLLLMPATRHNLIHLSEALLLKRKYQGAD